MRRWRELGALLQVNAGSFNGHYPVPSRSESIWRGTMVSEGLVDLVATDHHGTAAGRRLAAGSVRGPGCSRGEQALAERAMAGRPRVRSCGMMLRRASVRPVRSPGETRSPRPPGAGGRSGPALLRPRRPRRVDQLEDLLPQRPVPASGLDVLERDGVLRPARRRRPHRPARRAECRAAEEPVRQRGESRGSLWALRAYQPRTARLDHACCFDITVKLSWYSCSIASLLLAVHPDEIGDAGEREPRVGEPRRPA